MTADEPFTQTRGLSEEEQARYVRMMDQTVAACMEHSAASAPAMHDGDRRNAMIVEAAVGMLTMCVFAAVQDHLQKHPRPGAQPRHIFQGLGQGMGAMVVQVIAQTGDPVHLAAFQYGWEVGATQAADFENARSEADTAGGRTDG